MDFLSANGARARPWQNTACRYGPVSLDLSVVVSQTTGPRDSPHRRGSGSGTGPLESVSMGPVPDPETVPKKNIDKPYN